MQMMYHSVMDWDPLCVPLFLFFFLLPSVTYSYCCDPDIDGKKDDADIQTERERRGNEEKG